MSNLYKFDKTQLKFIEDNLDGEGKLSCLKAFKVARLIGKKPIEMAQITKELNIKITNCELGVFGDIEFYEKNDDIYEKLSHHFYDEKKIECKVLWNEAKNWTLHKVGSTAKNSDIKVVYCQLGCFKERKGHGSKS